MGNTSPGSQLMLLYNLAADNLSCRYPDILPDNDPNDVIFSAPFMFFIIL